MIRFFVSLALGYLILGSLFAIATFIGSKESCPNFSLEERVHLSLTAIVIWPYAVHQALEDILDTAKYRRKK